MLSGHIYILSNPSLKSNWVKIGLTQTNVEKRKKSLSKSSSIPLDFIIEYECTVNDVKTAERRIHLLLEKYRVNESKEFFDLPLKNAIKICQYVTAYEVEDDSICNDIGLHRNILGAHYGPEVTFRLHKLIYILIGATTNNTIIDRIFQDRRGIVDGFLKHQHLTKFSDISSRAAMNAMASLENIGLGIWCQPMDGEARIDKIFEYIKYHKGHLAWRFTDNYREMFENGKL
ncbi:GIY-YIG nuclease family protein [Chromobacterium haemolyticum]|uniref:GIY-YIG nuclease family protein n=1 Tax=Chromobacterium haemolyticum TaxID=394935 RepID=UPI004055806C